MSNQFCLSTILISAHERKKKMQLISQMHQVDTLSKHNNVIVVLPEKLRDSLLHIIGKPSFLSTFS